MNNKFCKIWLFVLLISLHASCDVHTVFEPQSKKETNTQTKAEEFNSKSSVKVRSIFQAPKLTDAKMETVLKQPAPDIYLALPCPAANLRNEDCKQGEFRIDLPLEAKGKIENYWITSLRFKYITLVKKEPFDTNAYYKISSDFSKASQKFADDLTTLCLELPNNRREISTEEADDIVQFINEKSIKVIELAIELQN